MVRRSFLCIAPELARIWPGAVYDSDMTESKAMILGCSGHSLTPEEKALFSAERPWGFILFGRNISEPQQAASAGGYGIQIASLPSQDEATKSYANLSKKFAGVLGGRAHAARLVERQRARQAVEKDTESADVAKTDSV